MGFNGPPPKRSSKPFVSIPPPLKVTKLTTIYSNQLDQDYYDQGSCVGASSIPVQRALGIPAEVVLDMGTNSSNYASAMADAAMRVVCLAKLTAKQSAKQKPEPPADGKRTFDLD